jgi:hypothetical protein
LPTVTDQRLLPLAFYFNFKGAIFGRLVSVSTSSLPHNHFIATCLLPCGKLDGKIKKFTSSDDIGDATDDITMAIHAYAHFSHLYSGGHIVMCDLQGMLYHTIQQAFTYYCCLLLLGIPDNKGLIDPQAHT